MHSLAREESAGFAAACLPRCGQERWQQRVAKVPRIASMVDRARHYRARAKILLGKAAGKPKWRTQGSQLRAQASSHVAHRAEPLKRIVKSVPNRTCCVSELALRLGRGEKHL